MIQTTPFLSLGVFSALQEIKWVQAESANNVELKYYYLGFYIHSCPKMRYKAQYKPSDLLCPENFEWVPLSDCLPKLNATKYTRLLTQTPTLLSEKKKQEIIRKIPVFYQSKVICISDLTKKGQSVLHPILLQWLERVGSQLAVNILCGIK